MSLPTTYRPMDIAWGLRANARRFPDRTAVSMSEGKLTYARLVERSNRVSNGVAAAGLGPGENAAIVMANRPEYFEIVAGVSSTGSAIATVNPRQSPREIGDILQDCGARIIFTDPDHAEQVQAADLPEGAKVIVAGAPYEDWLARAADTPPASVPAETDTFSIPYTSGTTGRPKGVCLSHRSRVISFFQFASVYGCFGKDDRFLVTTPLFHGGGFAFPMATLFLGGEVELMPRYAPDLLARLIASGQHSGTFVVPTQLHQMFELDAAAVAGLAANRFRSVICNAAPLPEDTKHAALRHFGEGRLHETYGSTEGGVITNLYPDEMRRKQNCAGRPIPGQLVKLLGEDGREVGPGEVGELFSNGPTLFNGYLGRPEETAASLRDGWYSAGDLARADAEGFFYIVDRKKDMILSGGVNIYPRDIEEVLYAHPQIAEAAVVGIPDPRWGEAVCAFLRPAGSAPDVEEVLGWCRRRLAPHKIPKTIRYVEQIPRNAAGKVLKRELRDQMTDQAADA